MHTAIKNKSGTGSLTTERLKHTRRASASGFITPMIDIIFLLLTFFILTANFRLPEDFLALKLPSTSSSHGLGIIEPFHIDIAPTDTGYAVSLGGNANSLQVAIHENTSDADLALLAQSLLDSLNAQKRTAADPVEITCDDRIRWDSLVKIYNIINAAGIEDVTFNINE